MFDAKLYIFQTKLSEMLKREDIVYLGILPKHQLNVFEQYSNSYKNW